MKMRGETGIGLRSSLKLFETVLFCSVLDCLGNAKISMASGEEQEMAPAAVVEPSVCKLCGLTLSSHAQLDQHRAGKAHKRRVCVMPNAVVCTPVPLAYSRNDHGLHARCVPRCVPRSLQAQEAADASTTVHLSGYPVETPAASLEAAAAVFGPVVSVSTRHGCVLQPRHSSTHHQADSPSLIHRCKVAVSCTRS